MAAKRKSTTAKEKAKGGENRSDPLDTPVMRQFLEIKERHADAILFFRMGDFYELFLEDAQVAAPLMDVALTSRQGGVPMAGVPFHSAEIYIARLLKAGRKVAIAEQESDPQNPKLMRRRVRRVLSPGTVVEESLLKGGAHNYLMAVVNRGGLLGVALSDVSTGDFFTHQFASSGEGGSPSHGGFAPTLRDLYYRYAPGEILATLELLPLLKEILPEAADLLMGMEEWKSSSVEGVRRIRQNYQASLKGLGYDDESSPALGAASLILHYVAASFPDLPMELDPPVLLPLGGSRMLLDEQTIRNLDLIHNLQEGGSDRTLFRVLDRCKTSAGHRFLREAILMPLLDEKEIGERQRSISFFLENEDLQEKLRILIEETADLERIIKRILSGRGNPRDLASLRSTVQAARKMAPLLEKAKGVPARLGKLFRIDPGLLSFTEELESAVEEEPPVSLGSSPFLKRGIFPKLDKARDAGEKGARWILEFEEEERKSTGISTLRVKYNRVVGYFIEVSRAQSAQVPSHYLRKQTLVGNERYTSERLEELERTMQSADEVIQEMEAREFRRLCEEALSHNSSIKGLMGEVALLDFLLSLSHSARRYSWNRPKIATDGEILIEEGRHPVVERYLPPGEQFIPNSVHLKPGERQFAILTGPNMAGKSTYIRQIALIQLLMQIGSFVPAKSASLSVVDNIFTRIGAGDNLTRGESTFFVEMLETARILNRCTSRSLVIMDEIGRGTSTYDGLSIAWAVVEHLSDSEGPAPATLFATHYHELTSLESRPGVFNLTMDVEEAGGRVVFLRRIREGAADESYGIHVARLAGLPPGVVQRAEEKLKELENEMEQKRERPLVRSKFRSRGRGEESPEQPGLF